MHLTTGTNRNIFLGIRAFVATPIMFIDTNVVNIMCNFLRLEHTGALHVWIRAGLGVLWFLVVFGLGRYLEWLTANHASAISATRYRAAIEGAKEEGRNEMLAALKRQVR